MKGIGQDRGSGRLIADLLREGTHAGCSDARLVERFVMDRSERAFATLLDRHGPRVFRVCRAIAGDRHAAEDAFQATFLVLARKARSLRVAESLGPWLHGVAIRVATTARTIELRRRRREARVASARFEAIEDRRDDAELARLLHMQIGRLPASLRDAVLLCDVEGLSREEAADRLCIPVGTLKSRHSRGRERLRAGLARRGILPATCLAAAGSSAARASLPEALRTLTIRNALSLISGRSAAGLSTAAAYLLSLGVETTMMTKVRLMLAGLIVGLGAATMYARATPAQDPGTRGAVVDPNARATNAALDRFAAAAASPVDVLLPSADTPPSADEILAALAKRLAKEARIEVEKVGVETEPEKVYPVVGRCVLVHVHYKCTIRLGPDPTTGASRVEVVYLDRDYLHRVNSGESLAPQDLDKFRQKLGMTGNFKPLDPTQSVQGHYSEPTDPRGRSLSTLSQFVQGDGTKPEAPADPRGKSLGALYQEVLRDNTKPAGGTKPAVLQEQTTPNEQERRLIEVEKKLDLILKALQGAGKVPAAPPGGASM